MSIFDKIREMKNSQHCISLKKLLDLWIELAFDEDPSPLLPSTKFGLEFCDDDKLEDDDEPPDDIDTLTAPDWLAASLDLFAFQSGLTRGDIE